MIPETAFHKLEDVYRALDGDLPSVGGVCTACGRCCNFAESDFELYASRLEIEYMKRSTRDLDTARGPDVCPFLTDRNQCGAREHRALGCRTYFRVIRDRPGSEALYEKYLARIKRICDEEGIPWAYARVLPVLEKEGKQAWATA